MDPTGSNDEPKDAMAHAIVLPFGAREFQWLLDHTPKQGSNDPSPADRDKDEENPNQKYPSGSIQSCGIPFYHIGDGQWPIGGKIHHHKDWCHPSNGNHHDNCFGDSLFITSAVIVTLKSISQIIESYLPSHMRILTSIISGYLSSPETTHVSATAAKGQNNID
jgi:hypothetical protein